MGNIVSDSGVKELVSAKVVVDGVAFILKDGVITSCSGDTVGELVLPEQAVAIEDDVFKGKKFSSVKLPDKLLWIGKRAFKDCINLKELELPSSVLYSGEQAFCGCKSLKSADLGSLEDPGAEMFKDCSALENVKFHDSLMV